MDVNTISWITGIISFIIGAALRIHRNRQSKLRQAGMQTLTSVKQPTVELRQPTLSPPSKFCISCGGKIPADSKFCPRCASKQE